MNSERNSKSKHHIIILDLPSLSQLNENCIVYPVSSESTFNFGMIGGYTNSCNGLLYFWFESYYICNPTTNECKTLPYSRLDDPPPGFVDVGGCTGLGFDSRSNDYKVIRFVEYRFEDEDEDEDDAREREKTYPANQKHAEVYSFKNGTWRSLTDFPEICPTSLCVYADGCCHWLIGGELIVFDVAEETFSTISLEEDVSESLKSAYDGVPVERDGCVGVLVNNKSCLLLWVKTPNKEGGSWNKLFQFDASEDLHPLGFSKNENGEFGYFTTSDAQVWVYDFAADHLNKLQILLRNFTQAEFISYVETTVSLP